MKAKFDALLKNQIWELVPCALDKNIISCKWLFKIKQNLDGFVDRYKDRLVSKGFPQ